LPVPPPPLASGDTPNNAVPETNTTQNFVATEIPLFGGEIDQHTWALLNLILGIVGLVPIVIVIIRRVMQKKRKNLDTWERYEGRKKRQKTRCSHIMIAMTMLLGIVGIILFALTQDMRLQMVFVDWWTIVHAILVIAGFISYTFAFRRDTRDSKSELSPNY